MAIDSSGLPEMQGVSDGQPYAVDMLAVKHSLHQGLRPFGQPYKQQQDNDPPARQDY